MDNYILKECIVIGAGISGIAMARWLKQYNIDFLIVEKSNDFGGLWRYKEDGYGVMSFTHINVSKYNYCFPDHPYPDETPEFMHHRHIYDYVKSYIDKHKLFEKILFESELILIEEIKDNDSLLNKSRHHFHNLNIIEKLWKVTVKDLKTNTERYFVAPYVALCTGHHCVPRDPELPGQETFTGEIIHSVKFKSSKINKMEGKKVLLVGIGNSSVDVADNLVTEGGSPQVTICARNGSWILPNYISGYTVDLFVNRFFLWLPWKVGSTIFESIIKVFSGHPNKYNLNPKCRLLQSHPTVSPTLIHHIQRKKVLIQPNIKKIEGNEVTFENDEKSNFDAIVKCTGYKIKLDFLHDDVKQLVFSDKNHEFLNLFKLVFQPRIGASLGFIGFVQPHSGGILEMSDIQARWMVYLMKNMTKLPSEQKMIEEIQAHKEAFGDRFYKSSRHTIQEDPITYNDGVASLYGAKPDYVKNLPILWRLIFGSNGPAQWRLNGPDAMEDAEKIVRSVPVPDSMRLLALILFVLLTIFTLVIALHPELILLIFALVVYYFRNAIFAKQARTSI